MNQDFTVQKRAIFDRKKNSCRRVHLKKKFLHKQWAKKKIRAELKIPQPPPITFLMVRPLRKYFISPIFGMTLKRNDMLT